MRHLEKEKLPVTDNNNVVANENGLSNEELAQQKKQKKKLYIILGLLIALTISIFVYFYIKQISPKEVWAGIPLGEINNPPSFSYHIFGATDQPFILPLATMFSGDEIFVSDSDGHKVQVFDYNGNHLRTFGHEEGEGSLSHPYGMAEFNGEIYVANGGRGSINVYSRSGEFKRKIEPENYENMGIPAQLVIRNNHIYYTDLAQRKVFVMTLDGKDVLSFGGQGSEEGKFDYPHGIAVDQAGNIYVADSGNNRVQKFDSEGNFMSIVGKNESSTGEMAAPRGLAFDNRGNLYVVAGLENMIYVFDSDGEFKFNFNKIEDDVALSLPNSIAIDSNNRIIISETFPARIAVFKY